MSAHVAAVAAVVGAWWAPSVPVWVPLAVAPIAVACRCRRGAVLALAVMVGLGAAASATHAVRSLDFPAAGPFDGWVTLVDDPRTAGPVGVRVTVRAGRQRLAASAHGPVAGRLDDAAAGEQVRIVGTVRPVSTGDHRSIHRHVVGRLTVHDVVAHAGAAPVSAAANAVRGLLDHGATSIERGDRALFLGMVIGDDRGQRPVTADDFRAAGLGHLLVVSGQNVAFVLAVAMPVAGRLRPAGRAVVLLLLLGLFAVATRFEPSVLRATAMAGLGIGSAALGRPTDGRAGLSWAVAGLLVVDPFLVHVVAFRLSAAATGGIVWFGPALAARLPGPGWLRVPLSTTATAQLGVSPVLLAIFGPIPLASLPANLVAGPVSGAVMIWGCTGGLVAGLVGGRGAELLHWPTNVLLWWVREVAGAAAAAPAATLGARSLVVLAGCGLVAVRSESMRLRRASALVSVVVFAIAVIGAPALTAGTQRLDGGVVVHHGQGHTIVVLDDPAPPRQVLERLRLAGVRRPALLIATDGDRADADVVVALRDRFGPIATAAPPLHRVPGARTVQVGQEIRVGPVVVRIGEVSPRLEWAIDP